MTRALRKFYESISNHHTNDQTHTKQKALSNRPRSIFRHSKQPEEKPRFRPSHNCDSLRENPRPRQPSTPPESPQPFGGFGTEAAREPPMAPISILTGCRYVLAGASSRCRAVSRYLSRQGRSPSLSDMGRRTSVSAAAIQRHVTDASVVSWRRRPPSRAFDPPETDDGRRQNKLGLTPFRAPRRQIEDRRRVLSRRRRWGACPRRQRRYPELPPWRFRKHFGSQVVSTSHTHAEFTTSIIFVWFTIITKLNNLYISFDLCTIHATPKYIYITETLDMALSIFAL